MRKTETTLKRLRSELAGELKIANEQEKSSLQELGNLIGLSRQRVFQLVREPNGDIQN